MKAATCFSGIGAPETAMSHWDWRWCAEIEKFPSAVLAHHFPHSVNLGDVTAEDFLQRASSFGQLDVLAGGPPCQAFSVAGLRKSMADDRGNLSLRFVRIAHAVRPRNLVVENVPGWLNTPDNAFGCFLGAILGHDDALHSPLDGKWPRCGMASGPLGRLCWATLDAQYFGVAQRRRRVFVVVDFGNGADPAAVLFEPESVLRHSPSRREAGQGTAHNIASSLTASGRGVERGGDSRGQDPVVAVQCADIAPTLNAAFADKQGLEDQHINGGGAGSLPSVSTCLNAGKQQRLDPTFETLIPVNRCGFDDADIAHTLKGEGFDASEDGTGRGTPLVPVAFAQNTRDEVRLVGGDDQIVGALAAEAGMKQTSYIAFPAELAVAQPITIMERGRSGGSNLEYRQDGTANTLLTPNGGRGGLGVGAIQTGWQVRRLIPAECERLQGFTDGFTDITYRGKPAADGPRYKALGNSWAVPVGRWILERIERFMPAEAFGERAVA